MATARYAEARQALLDRYDLAAPLRLPSELLVS
jgi:hypothetical protein